MKRLTLVGLIFMVAAVGCSSVSIPNDPFRGPAADNPESLKLKRADITAVDCDDKNKTEACGKAVIEVHKNYDLVFFEFTERGNIFNRSSMNFALEHIGIQAKEQAVAIIVFVHGWKHNANSDDSNVESFRESLDVIGVNQGSEKQRIIGVYVGWRGLSLVLPGVKNATFWARKAVAEEVGRGGVTELLLRLRQISKPDDPANTYMVVGHSFGGAIVLTSLSELLLQRIVEAQYSSEWSDCAFTKPFADGVVLLNPAIEANQAVQLKELASEGCFADKQIKLLHVISTDGDKATKYAFVYGQWLNLALRWDQEEIFRTNNGRDIKLREKDLDIQSVGNHEQFRTGYLELSEETKESTSPWLYSFCQEGPNDSTAGCKLSSKGQQDHFLHHENNPIVFVKTDEGFMRDHTDVFNCNVRGYLATIVLDAIDKKKRSQSSTSLGNFKKEFDFCYRDNNFDFAECFYGNRLRFKSKSEKDSAKGTNESCRGQDAD